MEDLKKTILEQKKTILEQKEELYLINNQNENYKATLDKLNFDLEILTRNEIIAKKLYPKNPNKDDDITKRFEEINGLLNSYIKSLEEKNTALLNKNKELTEEKIKLLNRMKEIIDFAVEYSKLLFNIFKKCKEEANEEIFDNYIEDLRKNLVQISENKF